MADVRALLRSERASRRIVHPYASYSSAGQLSCSLCHFTIKSEPLWDSHVRSAGHVAALKQTQKAQVESNNRKRKAAEEETHHIRKKSRSGIEGGESAFEDEEDMVGEAQEAGVPPVLDGFVREEEPEKPAVLAQNVDEDEWAAFERDIATVPKEESLPRPIITSNAVISAQPVTAEELRAQAQKEDAARRQQRQADVEAEKEDATRALEDEFEEMEALEQRVKRLREQREALRSGKAPVNPVEGPPVPVEASAAQDLSLAAAPIMTDRGTAKDGDQEEDDEEEEDEDEGEWDLWRR